jgi:hypothetical protein
MRGLFYWLPSWLTERLDMAKEEDSGTELATPVAEAPETTEAEASTPDPEVDAKPEATEEPDYRALYEESETGRIKAEKDNSSMRGENRKALEVREALARIEDRIDGNERSTTAIGRAMDGGSTDGLKAELDTIATETAQKRATTNFDATFNELYDELKGAVLDGEGNPVLDLNEATELAGARQLWNEAAESKDVGGLTRAVTAALQESRKAERITSKAALKKEKENQAKARAEALDEAEAHDLGSGKAAMTGNGFDLDNSVAMMTEGLKERESAGR